MKVKTSTTIKGGLPVIVTGEFTKGHWDDYPGCNYLEDVMVMFPSGHEISFDLSDRDRESVEVALYDAARGENWS